MTSGLNCCELNAYLLDIQLLGSLIGRTYFEKPTVFVVGRSVFLREGIVSISSPFPNVPVLEEIDGMDENFYTPSSKRNDRISKLVHDVPLHTPQS